MSKSLLTWISLFSIHAIALLPAMSSAALFNQAHVNYQPRFTLFGNTGTDTEVGMEYMHPFTGDARSLWYGDIGAIVAGSDDARAGFLGTGYRQIRNQNDYIVGGYLFADHWRSPKLNYYSQLTLGAEALGLIWDFRGNLYFPFGDKSHLLRTTFNSPLYATGHKLVSDAVTDTYEIAERGLDVEVGRYIPNSRTVRAYLGYYHFGFGGDPSIDGPKVRLEYRYSPNLTLTASEQYDNEQGNKFLIGARLSFGGTEVTNPRCLESRMMDPIPRQHVLARKRTKPHSFTSPENFYFVDEANPEDGSGTFEDPYQDLPPAMTDATNDTNPYKKYIYLFADEGGALYTGRVNLFQGLPMGPNQEMTSSAIPFIYHGTPVSNLQGDDSTPMIRGAFTLSNNDNINHVEMSGFDSALNNGLLADGVNNIVLDNITLHDYRSFAFFPSVAEAGSNGADATASTAAQDGGVGNAGVAGGEGHGIWINNSSHITLSHLIISEIRGGDGQAGGAGGIGGNGSANFMDAGNGGSGGAGGNGGNSIGLLISNSSDITLHTIEAYNIFAGKGGVGGAGGAPGIAFSGGSSVPGGAGGAGGSGGAGGTGGAAFGISLINTQNVTASNLSAQTITNSGSPFFATTMITAGDGGAGGAGHEGGAGASGTTQGLGGAGGNGGIGGNGGGNTNGTNAFAGAVGIAIDGNSTNVSILPSITLGNNIGSTTSFFSTTTVGNGGTGGAAGNGGTGSSNGADGIAGNGGNGANAAGFIPSNASVPSGNSWYSEGTLTVGQGGSGATAGSDGTAFPYTP